MDWHEQIEVNKKLLDLISKPVEEEQSENASLVREIGFAIHSISKSIEILANSQQTIDALILLRSLLEHHICLRQVSRDTQVIPMLRKAAARGEKILLNEMQRGNPYVAGLLPNVDIDAANANFASMSSELEEIALRPFEQLLRDEEGGENAYIVYRELSKHAHPHLLGLKERVREATRSQGAEMAENATTRMLFQYSKNIIEDAITHVEETSKT